VNCNISAELQEFVNAVRERTLTISSRDEIARRFGLTRLKAQDLADEAILAVARERDATLTLGDVPPGAS
jgi:hypothetical protein